MASSLLLLGLTASAALELPATVTRRNVLQKIVAGTTAAAIPLAASAFDLPPLDAFEDPTARAAYVNRPNPPLMKQQSEAFYAVTINDIESLKAMAQNGWELGKLQDSAGKTVLHRAAQIGNSAAVEVLIGAGAPVDCTNQWDETPLHFATRNGKLTVVKQLVDAGAGLGKKTYGGDTALSLSKKYRMAAIEEYLAAQ